LPTRVGQALVDPDEPVEVVEVALAADGQHRVRVAERGPAELLVVDPVAAVRDELEVGDHLVEHREPAVGSDPEPEVLLGGGNRGCRRRGRQHGRDESEGRGKHGDRSSQGGAHVHSFPVVNRL
jgi:hypothetical protein